MHETSAPRELAIDKDYHHFYEALKSGKVLPELKGYEMAYIFAIAMAYGVYHNIRRPIEPGKIKRSISGTLVGREFGSLITAIAISVSEEGVDIVPDKAQIFKIAEEYANGGIEKIKTELETFKPGEFELNMEEILSTIVSEPSTS